MCNTTAHFFFILDRLGRRELGAAMRLTVGAVGPVPLLRRTSGYAGAGRARRTNAPVLLTDGTLTPMLFRAALDLTAELPASLASMAQLPTPLSNALPTHLLAETLSGETLTVPDPSAPEGALFGASLFPYLAFLYFLGYSRNQTPPLALFGFTFLLAFVFGSIPAAIVAAATFNVTLADCDFAHGTAESLLTLTNLLIVIGFRQGPAPINRGSGGGSGGGGGGGSAGGSGGGRLSAAVK